MLSILQDASVPHGLGSALVLAVLQGLAEFLPVSSSGHLVLGRAALGVREAGLAFDVALHVGTLAAVLWAYRADVRAILADLRAGRWRTAAWLVVATVPIGVVGLSARGTIERAAQSTASAAGGLLVTAAVLVLGERARARGPRTDPAAGGAAPEPAWSAAWVIGCAQVAALWPGVSRSGATIVAGLCLGLPGAQAARLSFLMSLPAVAGAAVVELPHALDEGFGGIAPSAVLVATVVSALVGVAALRGLLLVLQRGALWWFAAYCALLGSLALALL